VCQGGSAQKEREFPHAPREIPYGSQLAQGCTGGRPAKRRLQRSGRAARRIYFWPPSSVRRQRSRLRNECTGCCRARPQSSQPPQHEADSYCQRSRDPLFWLTIYRKGDWPTGTCRIARSEDPNPHWPDLLWPGYAGAGYCLDSGWAQRRFCPKLDTNRRMAAADGQATHILWSRAKGDCPYPSQSPFSTHAPPHPQVGVSPARLRRQLPRFIYKRRLSLAPTNRCLLGCQAWPSVPLRLDCRHIY
jgi:hypothetical protein